MEYVFVGVRKLNSCVLHFLRSVTFLNWLATITIALWSPAFLLILKNILNTRGFFPDAFVPHVHTVDNTWSGSYPKSFRRYASVSL